MLTRPALIVSGCVLAVGAVLAGGYAIMSGKMGGGAPERATKAPGTRAAPAQIYDDAVRRIEAKDWTGLSSLREAAGLGYAPAQFYLAKLYEDGQAGLSKDPTQARRWTQLAAEGGERGAMHNLALYEVEGVGGPKDPAGAAGWFRRAADLGLVDSQYNLARLYEAGVGVARNPAEAYKWYLIASRSGDTGARANALRLKSRLLPKTRTEAERAAESFRPRYWAP